MRAFGELIQIDGSDHDWFEDRGPRCVLLVFVDDATGKLMDLHFCASEATFEYWTNVRRYLERYGRPVAFYSDKATVFRVKRNEGLGGSGITRFGRAMQELNIDVICANSPAAKRRVERAHQTLQDRLVKALRLAGVSSMDAGNASLERFRASYNAKFGRPARDSTDLHCPLFEEHRRGDASFQEARSSTSEHSRSTAALACHPVISSRTNCSPTPSPIFACSSKGVKPNAWRSCARFANAALRPTRALRSDRLLPSAVLARDLKATSLLCRTADISTLRRQAARVRRAK